jgi:hypothetical protein
MGPFLVLLVSIVLFMTLATFGLRWYANRLVRTIVGHRHRDAAHIVETGEVPPRWAGRRPTGSIRSVPRARHRRRLRALIAYFEHTPLVDGPESREAVLAGLRRAQDSWAGQHDRRAG